MAITVNIYYTDTNGSAMKFVKERNKVMSGTVSYSTAYKIAFLLISLFVFLFSTFIIIINIEYILLLLINIPFIFLTVQSFTFKLTFDSNVIKVKSAFRKYKEYSPDEIITYHSNKISHYGGNVLIIKTINGKIIIPSDCKNIDEFREFLIKYRPIYIKN